MTSLSAIGPATGVATPERTSAARADDAYDAEAFAGMFASAMSAPKRLAGMPASAERTSELEQAPSAPDESDTGDVGENVPALESKNPPSVDSVVRSINTLAPEMRAKLTRVIARVERETGHNVAVAETYRSQARQDALFAQGRTTDGPVVTWTQRSKHSQGRAVDLMLDNGAASSEAYQALQRIANEEGLRTLGAKDPGHLELRGNASSRADATSPNPTEPADATGSGQVSVVRLAQVARVADVQVAQPATVARVAHVAQLSTAHAVAASKAGDASTNGGSRRDSSNDPRGGSYSAFAGFSTRDLASQPGQPVTAAAASTASDAVARAERVLNAKDSAPARPLSHITMSVDGANGTTDRVHVALRGTSLDTTIDAGDARVANLLRARSDELSQALRRDGVELRELRVRSAMETGTVTAATAGQPSQSFGGASAQSRFDRGDAWQKQQDQKDRQRPQQERGRQQQRQRRGGER